MFFSVYMYIRLLGKIQDTIYNVYLYIYIYMHIYTYSYLISDELQEMPYIYIYTYIASGWSADPGDLPSSGQLYTPSPAYFPVQRLGVAPNVRFKVPGF